MAAQTNQTQAFGCGKMSHVLRRGANGKYDPHEWLCSEAAEAFAYGDVFIKIDGSCWFMMKDGDRWQLYRRQDKKKWGPETELPDGFMRLHAGGNTDTYEGHYYVLQLMPRSAPEKDENGKIMRSAARKKLDGYDKGERKLVAPMYKILDHPDVTAHLDAEAERLERNWFTFEAVGKKFQQTPGVDADVDIALHHEQCIDVKFTTIEDAHAYIMKHGVEGLIFHHGTKSWKLRGNCYDPNFSDKNAPAPVCLSRLMCDV